MGKLPESNEANKLILNMPGSREDYDQKTIGETIYLVLKKTSVNKFNEEIKKLEQKENRDPNEEEELNDLKERMKNSKWVKNRYNKA
ncbi:unnamed protein product [Moneuplotes crassus]|uniref:Uncharacterized protein n=1 Tax=Euplotes crassus TaxID=5936 RepID=A0AAD1XVJ5_EUPCR|nr:unnamed protein product [Moneuplotes crassus]